MKYCLIPLALFLPLLLGAQVISSFGADFTRSVTENSTTEQSSGRIRIQFPADVMVFVRTPVNQWLHYSSDGLLIYYPDDEKFFKLDRSSFVAPPFVSSLISAVKEDFGLSELGFTIKNSSVSADTLLFTWQAPDSLKTVSRVELRYQGTKMTSSQSFDSRDSLVLANSYSDHLDHRGYLVPLRISSWQKTAQGGKTEEIEYTGVVFNEDYSQMVKQFQLLEGQYQR